MHEQEEAGGDLLRKVIPRSEIGEEEEEQKRGRVELERTSGKKTFLGWLLGRKDGCPISCPPSWGELF